MTLASDPGLTWRKSSFSGGGNGGCVEVAWPEPLVAIRDSKHPTGPTLTFPHPRGVRFSLLGELTGAG